MEGKDLSWKGMWIVCFRFGMHAVLGSGFFGCGAAMNSVWVELP